MEYNILERILEESTYDFSDATAEEIARDISYEINSVTREFKNQIESAVLRVLKRYVKNEKIPKPVPKKKAVAKKVVDGKK
jgi:citrate lyase gamma subunit